MPPTRGATTESAAITGTGRGRCKVFTRSTPKPKSCPSDCRVEVAQQLIGANNQLAPLVPLTDGASKARTQEAKRHKKVPPSPDPARDQGFPRRTRAEAQENHHNNASKEDTAPKRRRRPRFRPQPEQDF